MDTIARHMQTICRLRIADFLDKEKLDHSIESFLDTRDQEELVRIAKMKKQWAVVSKKQEARSKNEKTRRSILHTLVYILWVR